MNLRKFRTRISNAWKLSRIADDEILAELAEEAKEVKVEGNKKAVFLPAMTEDEITQFERNEEGWGKFVEQIKSIVK